MLGRALVVVCAVLAFSACSDDEPDAAPSPRSTTTTTAGPSIEAGDPRAPEGAGSPTTTGAAADGSWPAALTSVEHGGDAWAVYLAVERDENLRDGTTPKLAKAVSDAEAVGYDTGTGDVDCDAGAKAALKLDPARKYTGVALYFRTEADARRFVALFQPGVVGVARVQTGCAD